MRPLPHRLGVLCEACLVALVCVSVAVAHRAPARTHREAATVSSNVPYVAPWQTEFTKYATQLYPLKQIFANVWQLAVPQGQWYRIVFLSADFTTDANVQLRHTALEYNRPGLTPALRVGQPGSVGASLTLRALFAPNVPSFVLADANQPVVTQNSVPDVQWGPGTTFSWRWDTAGAGDAIVTTPVMGVEIYTEHRPGVLVAAAEPTPLVS